MTFLTRLGVNRDSCPAAEVANVMPEPCSDKIHHRVDLHTSQPSEQEEEVFQPA